MHRKHHAFTDEEGDPHSPKLEGFWQVQLGNVFYYVREIKKTDVVERYARDIKDGWWDTHLFNRGLLGLGIGTRVVVRRCRSGHRRLVGAARGRHSRRDVRVRAVVVDQRALPPRRLQELRQHGDQHPCAGVDHRRRGAAQQPSRVSAQPEVQLPRERDRSRLAADQAADRAEARQAATRRSPKSLQRKKKPQDCLRLRVVLRRCGVSAASAAAAPPTPPAASRRHARATPGCCAFVVAGVLGAGFRGARSRR